MTGTELMVLLKLAGLKHRIVYSDEFAVAVAEEEDKLVITTSPEPEIDMMDVDMLIDALNEVNLKLDVYINELALEDTDCFDDFKEFDLFTEE